MCCDLCPAAHHLGRRRDTTRRDDGRGRGRGQLPSQTKQREKYAKEKFANAHTASPDCSIPSGILLLLILELRSLEREYLVPFAGNAGRA